MPLGSLGRLQLLLQGWPRHVAGQMRPDTEMQREFQTLNQDGRPGRLEEEIGAWRDFGLLGLPLEEGRRPSGLPQFEGQSPYPSPLNQMLRRLPGTALY